MSDLPKLKPCPFCGESRQDWLTVEGCQVYCHECGAKGSMKFNYKHLPGYPDFPKTAQEAWNARADLLPGREELVGAIKLGLDLSMSHQEIADVLADAILKRIEGGKE